LKHSNAGALPVRSVPLFTAPRRSQDRTDYKMRRINGFVKFPRPGDGVRGGGLGLGLAGDLGFGD